METIYGESAEIQVNDGYSNGGGIALYAADDETISGGSGTEGSYNSTFRILWTITRVDGGSSYTGGITGIDWFAGESLSPFYQVEEADIWDAAQDGNLEEYYAPWNNKTSDDEKIQFLNYLMNHANGCYRLFAAG